MTNRVINRVVAYLLFLSLPAVASAAVTISAPHNQIGYTCSTCHTTHSSLTGSAGYNNICLDCHREGAPLGGNRAFVTADAADPFNRYTANRPSRMYQNSHRWEGSDNVPEAGAAPPQNSALSKITFAGNLYCVSCHEQHKSPVKKSLRIANDQDQICLDCHRSRNTKDHRDGTHPVGISYAAAVESNRTPLNSSPVNSNPANSSSMLKLPEGKVLCSTCHGIHYNDGNSRTFDNFSSLAFNRLSTSQGYLLRTDLRGTKVVYRRQADPINICTNCHTGKKSHNYINQDIQCTDCHGAHVEYDKLDPTGSLGKNVYLIRRYMNVSTTYSKAGNTVKKVVSNKRAFLLTTSSARNYRNADGTGVCQACHNVPTAIEAHAPNKGDSAAYCNNCHSHNGKFGSFSGSCTSCHGYPPITNTPGAPTGYAVSNNFDYSTQKSPLPVNEETSPHARHAGGGANDYLYLCDECHKGTITNSTHANGDFQQVFPDKTGIIASTGGADPSYAKSTQTCSSSYCHSDGATTRHSVSWTQAKGSLDCGGCHNKADDATWSGSTPHTRHISTYRDNGNLSCNSCHSATAGSNTVISDKDRHVNGIKDVSFNEFAGGSWNGTGCADTYCHSNGTSGTAPVHSAISWSGTMPADCTGCHGNATGNNLSGKHSSHLNPAMNASLGQGNGLGCIACHAKTVSSNTSINSYSLHVNRIVDYSGARAGRTANCANFYCHSNGKGTFVNPPAWTSTTTLACNGCHGVSSSAGAPDYASGPAGSYTANSHFKHTASGEGSCDTCHSITTSSGTEINPGSTSHINGSFDVVFNTAKAGSSATWTPETKSCSNISCHSDESAHWGGSIYCGGCHGIAVGNSSVIATGAHSAHINNAAILGTNFGCADCHAKTVSDNATINSSGNHANGFRDYSGTQAGRNASCANFYCHSNGKGIFVNPPAWNSGTALNCNGCHGTGTAAGAPDYASGPAGTDTANSHLKHTAAGAASCETCHINTTTSGSAIKTGSTNHLNGSLDVTFNTAKAGASATWTPATKSCANISCHYGGNAQWGATISCGGCHGTTAGSGNTISVGAHTAHVNNAAILGTNFGCVDCHAKTVTNTSTIISSGNHANGLKDYSGVRAGRNAGCYNFYCHSNGKGTFVNPPAWTSGATLACNGCHGTGNPAGAPDYASESAGSAKANSHLKHTVAGAASCDTCHTNTTTTGLAVKAGSTSHLNSSLDVSFNSAKAGTSVTWTPATKSCANISCHAGGSAQWGGTINCGGCHGVAAGSGNVIATGAHAAHINNGSILGTNLGCTSCHAKTVSSNTTINNSGKHANGMKDYSGARAGRSASCANFYCHSNGKGTFVNPPGWTSGATLACNGCHGTGTASGAPDYASGPAGSATANSHLKHTAAGVGSCDTCHTSTTTTGSAIKAGSTNHLNGLFDITFNTTKAGVSATWTPETRTCSSTLCHSAVAPIWGGTLPEDCTGCHGGNATSSSAISSGMHGRHVNQATILGVNYRCAACHDATTDMPNDRNVSNPANHLNGTTNIQFADGGSYSADKSCSATICHTAGKASAPQPASPLWTGSALGCNGCHGTGTAAGVPDYPNAGAAAELANSHPAHTADGAASCTTCHSSTTANGTSIVSGSVLHTNGQINVTFDTVRAGASATWTPETKSCTSTLCHASAIVWGSTLPADCTGCHGNDTSSSSLIITGKHARHLDNYTTLGRGNNFGCADCHAPTVSANRTLAGNGRHLNGLKDYSSAQAGTLTAATCATAYCHSTGMQVNQFWNMTGASWNSSRTLGCNGCHGGPVLPDGTFAAFSSVAGEPSYTNGGIGTPTANSHQAHVSGNGIPDSTGCSRCHRSTADAGVAGKFRDFSTSHLNRIRNVNFDGPSLANAVQTRYSSTTQQCLNIYCHSNAEPFDNSTTVYSTVRWGDAPRTCASCHDSGGAASRLSGRHGKHTGGFYAFSCSRCHFTSMNDDGTLKNKALHTNKSKEIVFREGGTYNTPTKGCSSSYCHSDARGGAPGTPVTWSDSTSMTCYSCHKGKTSDSSVANCSSILGNWSASKGSCTPDLTMASNGHHRLVGPQWVRKYPCSYCHSDTMNADGTVKSATKHLNGTKDVVMSSQWAIVGRPAPSYDPATKVCDNVYCHSDGTTDPEDVRPFAWTEPKTECNSCHGHPSGTCSNAGCHDGHVDGNGKVWTVLTGWPGGEEWRGSMPMFPNQGPGTARANSHLRHSQTNFTCDSCHAATVRNGICTDCHVSGVPLGGMGEVAHIDAAYHVNKSKDVSFKDGGSYNPVTKVCSNTVCHTSGTDPIWGGSVDSSVTCLTCHGTTGADQDDFNAFNGIQARINMDDWTNKGHGRYSTSGRYPVSNNPAANFPGNPCWYCHDNNVLHKDASNPYRLKMHHQYERRFEKECVYCHMERTDAECIACHVGQSGSLAPQATGSGIVFKKQDGSTETKYPTHSNTATCTTAGSCHDSDDGTFAGGEQKGHNVNAGIWTPEQKSDVKNQYMMMGVCLQCHDDDTGGQCTSCHTPPPGNPNLYNLGFDPGTGYIKPKQARASAGHFGYKHYRAFINSGGWTKDADGNYLGTWKGGKFCWDCHDPHGDSNIYMIQKKVATTTDGRFGKPLSRADVTFTDKQSGSNYAKKVAPFDGICNVCHSPESKHFTSNSGDGHNLTRVCTTCHEHRFADSHANRQQCNTCHENAKPVPKHTAFGLPRDCTKCHLGTVGKRMDVIGQMKSNSHHVQRTSGEIKNTDCYQCHWESTPVGLIDVQYHTGYNYKTYTSVKNDVVDLVLYGAGTRPTAYRLISTASGRPTATKFLAINMGTSSERSEVSNISSHCISCHSDQNNHSVPFDDCKTPRQYAWDGQSVAARYSQTGTTPWGKYAGSANAAKKNFTKAFSAHGNAPANQGGWDPVTGLDGNLTGKNQRTGNKGVQCFDCHNSHGSKVVGVTSSYVTFNGTNNGANLKETKQNIGGYAYDYKASSNASGVNPYGAGAGQCFDCHNSPTAGTVVPSGKTPWGYFSTYSSSAPVMGYKDTVRFGQGTKAFITKNNTNGWMDSRMTILGGHLKASVPTGSLAGLAKVEGTATGGSTTTLVDSGKSWNANQWRNFYLLITSGDNSSQLSKITANSATTLTLEGFAATVASGNGYKIVPYSAQINGLCTPCHDPHGVSPTLGSNQAYAVPLLKGTWMTSPYKEDMAFPTLGTHLNADPTWRIDRNSFGTSTTDNTKRINENDSQFAGLCLNCHKKETLTDGIKRNTAFKTLDRIHETVQRWGTNDEHSFTCSKCHQPHNSGLPRLMTTNCLDVKHRGLVASGGSANTSGWRCGNVQGFPRGKYSWNSGVKCHGDSDQLTNFPNDTGWNNLTPW